MRIAHNGTCTHFYPVLMDVRIARESGYDGIEIIGSKLYRYLDAGFDIDGVVSALDGLPVVGMGFVPGIERHEGVHYQSLLDDCETMCSRAAKIGAPMVQILTGPIGPGVGEPVPEGYEKIMAMDWPTLRAIAVKNLRTVSEIGRRHGVGFYLEALSWAPIHTLGQMVELIEEAGCDNIGVLVDFWHCYTSGTTPEDIARLDRKLIKAVHVCDSVAGDGSSHDDRDIWTGMGQIPLSQWADAVRSTGFDGWYSAELFCIKRWEMDPWDVARSLQEQLRELTR